MLRGGRSWEGPDFGHNVPSALTTSLFTSSVPWMWTSASPVTVILWALILIVTCCMHLTTSFLEPGVRVPSFILCRPVDKRVWSWNSPYQPPHSTSPKIWTHHKIVHLCLPRDHSRHFRGVFRNHLVSNSLKRYHPIIPSTVISCLT